ncbi:flagellar motor switch protein FliG [Tropicimonas sp.]|uniref:flagellar motor switch protein FliG n=1 Tax=Tropicimonas sp. TaxID=2067044 RepID=UPI003A89C916
MTNDLTTTANAALRGGPHAGVALNTSGEMPPARRRLTRQQKAAVIVKLLLSEGAELPLDALSETAQAALTARMGELRVVDRGTLRNVVSEFVGEMDSIALTFPDGIAGALDMLDGHISPATAARLRREAGVAARGDPWERIATHDTARLLRILEEESTEIGAVVLSKLKVSRSAELLGQLPGDRARALSYAISRTGGILPETVRRIGIALASQLDAEPVGAFEDAPVKRVGAILNFSPATTRDEVLAGLDETDSEFAADVRRTIFTFADIPARLPASEVPRIVRGVDQALIVTAFVHAASAPALESARDFLLDNMSKRMAESLREEMGETSAVKPAAGEEAINAILAELRRLVDNGEITLNEHGDA